MDLIHTEEEIKQYANLYTLSVELEKLSNKLCSQYNTDLIDICNKYKRIIEIELNKYNFYIGKECYAPDSRIIPKGNKRAGKIEGKFYFNTYNKSVWCTFRYKDGGFDNHSIKELTILP